MITTILTPYAGDGLTADTAIRPLVSDLFDQVCVDATGRGAGPYGWESPSVDLMVCTMELTGPQLASIKSDNRFFVLSPGPGNTGSALTTWLSGKGATGHGVTNSDDEATARAKLVDYCRNL